MSFCRRELDRGGRGRRRDCDYGDHHDRGNDRGGRPDESARDGHNDRHHYCVEDETPKESGVVFLMMYYLFCCCFYYS